MIDFILRPIRRRFGKDRKFYAAIDDMFGFIPHNIELYKLALIHKSASVTLDDGRQINNERLEFLGDAVIESVTSDYLFIEFPDQNEGFLTQLRSKMVSRQSLNEVAKRLNLDAHVITHSSASFSQKHIYGDAFEAMMGAIYLDQGYDFVNRLLINRIFGDYLRTGALLEEETDFKSRLIEWCQKKHHTIRFITSHDKNYSSAHPVFNCKVLIDDIEAGYGSGDSKKEAEQQAAFSVSQGFREEDCTKLFDKLDAIERGLVGKQRRTANEPKNSAEAPKAADAAESANTTEKSDGDGDAATSDERAAKGSGRSRSARRARRRAAATAAAGENAPVSEETGNGKTDNTADNRMDDTEAADNIESIVSAPATESVTTAEASEAAEAAGQTEPMKRTEVELQEEQAEQAKQAEATEPSEAPDTDYRMDKGVERSRPSRRSRKKAAPQDAAAESIEEITPEAISEAAPESAPESGTDPDAAVSEAIAGTETAETAAAPKKRVRRRQPKQAKQAETAAGAETGTAGATEAERGNEAAANGSEATVTATSGTAPAEEAAAEKSAPAKRRSRRRQSPGAKEEATHAGEDAKTAPIESSEAPETRAASEATTKTDTTDTAVTVE